MSASALAPVIYGAIPVFADVDYDNFGLSRKVLKDVSLQELKQYL